MTINTLTECVVKGRTAIICEVDATERFFKVLANDVVCASRRTSEWYKKRPKKNIEKKDRKKKCRMIKIPNDSLTERKNVDSVNLYILTHLDVNHFIDMSMKKICE
jgi:hypothetical protein